VVLSPRPAILLVVLALAIIGVLGAVSCSPNNDAHNDKGRTLTVVGKTPEINVVDLGAQGPTQGDLIVTNSRLYNESGKETIGHVDLYCVITDPADEPSEKAHMTECTKTFTLPGGQISVQGVEAHPNLSELSPGVNAISGGTGKYEGVGGEQSFEVRGENVINTFHFME
jgi:hypothetical protein